METPTRDTTPNTAQPRFGTVESSVKEVQGLLFPQREKKAAPAERVPAPKEPVDTSDDTDTLKEPDQPEVVDGTDEEEVVREPSDDTDEELEPQLPTLRKLKINDEIGEVDEEEAVKGYLRQSDYTRKTQEVAKERDAVKVEREKELPILRERQQKYADGITQIEETLKAMMPQEPDWDTLRVENPEDFARQHAEWSVIKDRLADVAAEKQRVQDEIAAQQQKDTQEYLQAENRKLAEAIPEWKDPKVADKELDEMASYAKDTFGFTDADLGTVVDSRLMLLLRAAYQGSIAKAKVPVIKKKIEEIRTATPGPKDEQRPKVTEEIKRSKKLRASGKVEDAAKRLELMDDSILGL